VTQANFWDKCQSDRINLLRDRRNQDLLELKPKTSHNNYNITLRSTVYNKVYNGEYNKRA